MALRRNLAVDSDRLWHDLMVTAKMGGTAKGGINRLTATAADCEVRDWFRDTCLSLGCDVRIDTVGNMIAIRPGQREDLLPIALGSHLDTQPTGGKFDGVLGVLAGIEALRAMVEAGYRTNAPIAICNWTNEEGSRFAPAMLCSGVHAGVFSGDYALARTDRHGVTLRQALSDIGYAGNEPAGQQRFSAYLELHIEQGPILEAESVAIGVVEGVQAVSWYELTITGRDGHTGATPMNLRFDALRGAARLIDQVATLADHDSRAVASVGLIEAKPNSRNVIAGEVFMAVDLRHPVNETLAGMEEHFARLVPDVLAPLGLTHRVERIWHAPAVAFDPGLIACVREAAERCGHRHRAITSGAGHDAMYLASAFPSTMIFVPSAAGLSHNEAEWTSQAQCAAGAEVLLNAVLAFDEQLAAEVRAPEAKS